MQADQTKMTKAIFFNGAGEDFEPYLGDDGLLTELKPLGQINFFVGANNSGKSRFLRGLAKTFSVYSTSLNPAVENPKHIPISLLAVGKGLVLSQIARSLDEIGRVFEDYSIEKFQQRVLPKNALLNEHDLLLAYEKLDDMVVTRYSDTILAKRDNHNKEHELLIRELGKIKDYFNRLLPMREGKKFQVTYIPVLRSLRQFYQPPAGKDIGHWQSLLLDNLKKGSTNMLQARTVLDHFLKETGKMAPSMKPEFDVTLRPSCIFTGESLYQQIYEFNHAKEEKQQPLKDFEDFLSENFFNGEKVLLRALSDDYGDQVYVKIGTEAEFPISNLGDGIQAIILLTFPVFAAAKEDNHLVFCEEPELFLHPGMQRVFTGAIRKFPKVQFFFATHSNHLLESSLDYPEDVAIFSFEKHLEGRKANFKVESLSGPGMGVLNLLGVRNASVFLANCTIWVEGISDRLYIRRYLELYMQQLPAGEPRFKEDLHFAFLEFGGNNIVHYDFSDAQEATTNIKASKLANRIFLIHDADTGKEGRHQLLYHQLGETYQMLPVREIENLLTPVVLQQTLSGYQHKSSAKLEFKEVDKTFYESEPLSSIVELMTTQGEIQKIFASPKGTGKGRLYDKAAFAGKAVAHLKKYDNLSEHAKTLAEKIYQFIKSHHTINV